MPAFEDFLLLLIAFIALMATLIIRRMSRQLVRRRDEIERWRAGWLLQRQWLAEFPDLVGVLENLRCRAEGLEHTDISDVRDITRRLRADSDRKAKAWDDAHDTFAAYQHQQRDEICKYFGVPAHLIATPEDGYRVAYQHLSAECDGCDDAPAPVQHHPV